MATFKFYICSDGTFNVTLLSTFNTRPTLSHMCILSVIMNIPSFTIYYLVHSYFFVCFSVVTVFLSCFYFLVEDLFVMLIIP